jgi:4-alpha-glucanotransferase
MDRQRASGILLHPTSLPGHFGIGDLGPEAYRFVEFLAAAGQSLWQVLPLVPTGFGNSPYMCFSAFAGNPLLISLDGLVDTGLLGAADLASPPAFPIERVDYPAAIACKWPLLEKAARHFRAGLGHAEIHPRFEAFCAQNAGWLDDYALFMALKDAHGGRIWCEWEAGAAARHPEAMKRWRLRLAEPILDRRFLQFVFFEQWSRLRDHCAAHGIHIVGDTPIYVAYDSADVWSRRSLFQLDGNGRPTVVGGVPPDYFSTTGQRWGNPIYRWDVMAEAGFEWWIDRLRADFALVDVVRLDHFRGFEAYWEIPADAETAETGRWVTGPGAQFFEAVSTALSQEGVRLRLIAEDLGVITAEVDELREKLGLPGMRVLQMAFGDDPKASEYRPHNHVRNCVVYTATHDHNTTLGWFTAEPGSQTTQREAEVRRERELAARYAGSDASEIHWDFIRLAMASVAHIAIVPLQDVLGLGTGSRMNRPGSAQGNWEWRFSANMLTEILANRLAGLAELYERTPYREREG